MVVEGKAVARRDHHTTTPMTASPVVPRISSASSHPGRRLGGDIRAAAVSLAPAWRRRIARNRAAGGIGRKMEAGPPAFEDIEGQIEEDR